MWRSPIAHFYGWENKLLPNPGDPRGYLWKSHQRFRIFSEMKIFRVAITDDAYIGTRILNSSAFNNLIVMANYNKETVNRNFVPTMQLKLESRVDGRRVFSPMTPRIVSFDKVFADKAIAEQYHSYEGIVTLVEYHIDVDTQDSVIEFDFSVPCSLDEPFFYAQAENLCFVDTLTIDYREISSKLAKVWATSFVGNATLELEHDFEEHIVTGKIDGVLMAGHGISLTWLNKAETR
jgi:hypothetical protein